MSELLHLRDFGVAGDGRTDDTLAVQRAINTATEGPPLFLDAGTYLCTEPLLVSSQTTIEGAGAASVLLFPWRDQGDGAEFCLGNRHRKNADEGDSLITLENFVLQGGTDGTPYGVDDHSVTHGISWRKVSEIEIQGVEVRNVSGFGICTTGCFRARYHNNVIRGTGRDGITSFPLINENDASFRQWPLEELVVTGNRLENIGDDGIAVHAGTAATINRNYPPAQILISANVIHARLADHPLGQGRGICLSGVTDARVIGNDMLRTVATGILVQSWERNPREVLRAQRITVSGNVLLDPGRSEGLKRVKCGIQVKGADHVQLTHNGILGAADRGIDIRDATAIDVSRNMIAGSGGKYAILASGGGDACHDLSITDNVLIHDSQPAMMLFEVENLTERHNVQAAAQR